MSFKWKNLIRCHRYCMSSSWFPPLLGSSWTTPPDYYHFRQFFPNRFWLIGLGDSFFVDSGFLFRFFSSRGGVFGFFCSPFLASAFTSSMFGNYTGYFIHRRFDCWKNVSIVLHQAEIIIGLVVELLELGIYSGWVCHFCMILMVMSTLPAQPAAGKKFSLFVFIFSNWFMTSRAEIFLFLTQWQGTPCLSDALFNCFLCSRTHGIFDPP